MAYGEHGRGVERVGIGGGIGHAGTGAQGYPQSDADPPWGARWGGKGDEKLRLYRL